MSPISKLDLEGGVPKEDEVSFLISTSRLEEPPLDSLEVPKTSEELVTLPCLN